MEQPLDPKKHEAAIFARELADVLHHGCSTGTCDRLYIAAAPAFLGLLRKHYSKPVQQMLVQEINSNLVALPPDAVRRHLPEFL